MCVDTVFAPPLGRLIEGLCLEKDDGDGFMPLICRSLTVRMYPASDEDDDILYPITNSLLLSAEMEGRRKQRCLQRTCESEMAVVNISMAHDR
jgi:hypothetical protein